MADVVLLKKKGKKNKLLRIRIKNLYFIFITHHYGYESLHLYLVCLFLFYKRLWTFPEYGKEENSIHKSNNHFPGRKSFVSVFFCFSFLYYNKNTPLNVEEIYFAYHIFHISILYSLLQMRKITLPWYRKKNLIIIFLCLTVMLRYFCRYKGMSDELRYGSSNIVFCVRRIVKW